MSRHCRDTVMLTLQVMALVILVIAFLLYSADNTLIILIQDYVPRVSRIYIKSVISSFQLAYYVFHSVGLFWN